MFSVVHFPAYFIYWKWQSELNWEEPATHDTYEHVSTSYLEPQRKAASASSSESSNSLGIKSGLLIILLFHTTISPISCDSHLLVPNMNASQLTRYTSFLQPVVIVASLS